MATLVEPIITLASSSSTPSPVPSPNRTAFNVVDPAGATRPTHTNLDRSERGGRTVQLCDWADVVRSAQVEDELEGVQGEADDIMKELDPILDDPDELESLEREQANLNDHLDDLRITNEDLKEAVAEAERDLAARREQLKNRRDRLQAARSLQDEHRRALSAQVVQVAEKERALSSLRQSATARRTHLITLLSHLFPIAPAPLPRNPTALSHLLFSIHSLPLPNSSYPPSLSDDVISSALGYAAQAAVMLAGYLAVPLNYPVRLQGSRSAIVDEISVMKGPRAFPLYARGVERYRFEYAVFLLNKNVEQLMYVRGVGVADLRNTLPNLKTLLLALSWDEGQAGFATAAMSVPARFASPPPLEPPPLPVDHTPSTEGTGAHDTIPTVDPVAAATAATLNGASPPPSERSTSPASTIRARSRSNSRLNPPEKAQPPAIDELPALLEGAAKAKAAADGVKVVVEAPSPPSTLGRAKGKGKGGWGVDVTGAVGAVGSLWWGTGQGPASEGVRGT